MTVDAEIQQTMKLIDISFKRTDCFCLDLNELHSSNVNDPNKYVFLLKIKIDCRLKRR